MVAKNQLLAVLPVEERIRVLALCKPVQLDLTEVLCEEGRRTRYAYFPTASFVSLIAQVDARHSVEVGMAGNEGMLGVQLAFGLLHDPLKVVVQGAGPAWRMDADVFRSELLSCPVLHERVHRYAAFLLGQRAGLVACLHFHEIMPRLARWLLLSQDRAHADAFPVTQEFLSLMLGVRRVGVTVAAGGLHRLGLIEYRRGHLRILDRPGLEAAACTCYAAERKLWRQIMRSPRAFRTVRRPVLLGLGKQRVDNAYE